MHDSAFPCLSLSQNEAGHLSKFFQHRYDEEAQDYALY
jgi:hypothetical protein